MIDKKRGLLRSSYVMIQRIEKIGLDENRAYKNDLFIPRTIQP